MIESILKSFEVWTDAQGIKSKARVKSIDNISLEGVSRLRELILDLAIRGKLVSQNIKDEPASVLLKKIIAKKNKLIEDKIIKKEKLDLSNEIIENRDIPSNWIQVFLQDVTSVITCGLASTPVYRAEGRIFLSAKNVKPFRFMPEDFQYVDEETYQKIISWGAKPEKGDILVTRVGAGIGESAIVDRDIEFAYYVSLTLVKPIQPFINSNFLLYWLNSPEGVKKSIEGTFGKEVSAGNLNVKQVRKFIFPLPPLSEQNRIVEKVNELMAVCDKLEEEKTNNLKTHHYLVNCLLETLTNATDADELQTAWERISNKFDTIFYTDDSIEQLKQILLELVIRGQFGTQNENDIPATELFKKIEAELTEKFDTDYSEKLSRDNSTIDPSVFHYAIPKSWIWCELQDLAILFNGKAHEQFIDANGKYQLVNSSFVSSEGRIFKTVSSQLTPLTKGDIAIVMSDVPDGNALVKCFLVEEDDKYSLNQRIGGISASSFVDINFLLLVLNRNKYYLQYNDGKKQSNLKKIQILSCPIPLPPFEEQQRIVAKVYELFGLCDSLKNKIEKANEINLSLSKTILEHI